MTTKRQQIAMQKVNSYLKKAQQDELGSSEKGTKKELNMTILHAKSMQFLLTLLYF